MYLFLLSNFLLFFFSDPLLSSGGGDADAIDGISLSIRAASDTSAVEIRAEQIVRHIEKNKALMEDNPKSEIDRM